MIKKLLCLLWISMSLFVSALHASERVGYFSMTIGQSVYEIDPFKIRSSTLKVGGGYEFSDFISLETFYTYYANASDSLGVVDLTQEGGAITVQATGIFPITDTIRITAKAGASKWQFNFKLEAPLLPPVREKSKGSDPVYGIGFLFDVDNDSTIRLEYEDFTLDDTDFSVITIGFQHYF